jgi:hypothetical protein
VLPACALVGLFLGIGIAVPTARALRHGAGRLEGEAAGSTASATPAAASPSTQAPARGPAPPVCKTTGPPRPIAPGATVGAGIEARAFGEDVALGYAASDTEAVVLRLDPVSLTTRATVTGTSKSPIRRVTPIGSQGEAVGLAVDVDRKNDMVRGRRTISVDPPLQVGTSAGNLVWAKRPGGPAAGKLWPLEGRADVESLRGAMGEVGGEATLALVFRRKSAIGLGLARGADSLAPKGKAFYFDSIGPSVGSPAVALNDGVVLAAWADRTGPETAWSVRQVRFYAGEPPGEPSAFVPPAGGKGGPVMSPSIAPLPERGFLFAWSEGSPPAREVRAVTLTEKGETVGQALALSSPGANAGQAQAVVTSTGHGVVAYLESAGSAFRVVATPISCGR